MPSLRSAWAGAPAIETPRQSVPMLTVAAALAIIVALGGWLSHARQAPAVDATQLESWRAMVVNGLCRAPLSRSPQPGNCKASSRYRLVGRFADLHQTRWPARCL